MFEYISLAILGQSIWFIALIVAFFAFKEIDDRKLLIYLAICSLIWSLHFWIIWLYAAAWINLFDVFKNLAWLKWKKNNYWIIFFISSYISIWIATFIYTGALFSFLPTITSVLGTIWVLYFRWIHMRLFLISTLLIWFSYNYIGWSYPWMISDIVLIWATIFWIYKLHNKDKSIIEVL